MLPTYKIVRFGRTSDGVLGRFGEWCTLEEEDRGNQRNISAIPAGLYLCERRRFNKGGYDTFEVTGVHRRSNILFHRGNTEEDTEGCILLGMSFGALTVKDEDTGKPTRKIAVLSSREAHDAWMASLEGLAAFWLEVEDYRA